MDINPSNMRSTYLAITIGPIYETIQRARKTRDLWASSFMLSQLMREILLGLEAGKYGTALSPDISNLSEPTKHHGAGIWNDNCFYAIEAKHVERLKKELSGVLRAAKAKVFARIQFDLSKTKKPISLDFVQLTSLFDQHFYCTAILHSRLPDQPDQEKVLIELGGLVASAETFYAGPAQYDDYIAEVLFRPETVLPLYDLGFDREDKVFTKLKFDRRLPSLLEIATREFKKNPLEYQGVVQIISEQYKAKAKAENRDAPTDSVAISIAREEMSATPEEDSEIMEILKKILDADNKPAFKKRHKYVAIVQSDGDGIGKIIKGFQDSDVTQMKTFSAQLMAFSKAAVDDIADYEGLPVYAGGDDLLFIAPLQNHKGENLFDLLGKIRARFEAQPLLKREGSSMSFGISIFYYKYPMGEALEEGRKQLFKVAKKLAYTCGKDRLLKKDESAKKAKNALAFRVMLHSGQAFGAVLQQDGPVWEKWNELLKASTKTDTAFLSGMVHRLELLEYLLEDACDSHSAEYFFEKHFNEARGIQKDFVGHVRDLAVAIYREHETLQIDAADEKEFFKSQFALSADEQKHWPAAAILRRRYCNNLLYSALRLIQFLNAEDHE